MASEQLTYYRDSGAGNAFVGEPDQVSSTGPGGGGTALITRGWDTTLKRMTRRLQITGTGAFNFQQFDGINSDRDPAAFFPLMPPNNLIYRIRAGIAAEYVSGTGVSRVGWGTMLSWSNLLLGANAAAVADDAFIGFLWYQVGATSVNWRAVAANHAGVNQFDKDTGLIAPDVPYSMRIDFDGRIGKRNVKWFIDEVEVASFTPGNDALGGSDTAIHRLIMGVNAQNGNVCAGHSEMIGGPSLELIVQEGV